jgi:micrococcal nuclease
MKNFINLFFCLILTGCFKSNLKPYKLISVSDGDTVWVVELVDQTQLKTEKVRLLGLDAPESSQDPWGKRAREFLEKELQDDQMIFLETQGKDRYGRLLSFIYDEDKNLINTKILKNGYAVLFLLNSNTKYYRDLKEAELYARKNKLNIWDDNHGLKLSPYEYRKKNK